MCVFSNVTENEKHTHNRFTALWILSGTTWVSWYQKKHSHTHTYRGHQSSLICFILLIQSMAFSPFNPLAWQSFSTISLQVFFGLPLNLAPPLYTPYISSPNHCLLFATHAHTIATCSAVVPRLCNPILVSLNLLLGILSCNFTTHIHLTILISTRWSTTSFFFLMGQVSLSCNILLRTQLLYNLPLTFNDIAVLVSNGTKLPTAWIYSIQFGFCSPQMQQHLHPHSTCHLNNKLIH